MRWLPSADPDNASCCPILIKLPIAVFNSGYITTYAFHIVCVLGGNWLNPNQRWEWYVIGTASLVALIRQDYGEKQHPAGTRDTVRIVKLHRMPKLWKRIWKRLMQSPSQVLADILQYFLPSYSGAQVRNHNPKHFKWWVALTCTRNFSVRRMIT